MQDDIKIEYTYDDIGPDYMRWVDIHMTNKRGTQYRAMFSCSGPKVLSVYNVTNGRCCSSLENAPKWVQKTIEEQMPIVAIMLS